MSRSHWTYPFHLRNDLLFSGICYKHITIVNDDINGLYYKHITIINDAISGLHYKHISVVNDDISGIYYKHITIVNDAISGLYYKHITIVNDNICGLYYKPMTIVNNDSRVVNKLDTSLTDKARVVIYDCHMFIVQATGWRSQLCHHIYNRNWWHYLGSYDLNLVM